MENSRSPSPKSVENIEHLRQIQEKMVAESLNSAFNMHRKLMDEILEEKSTIAKKLLENQSEIHSIRLQNEKLRHDQQSQARLLESKEALIAQLQEQDRKNMTTLSEKETMVKRLLFEKGDAEAKLISERQSHLKQMEKTSKEAEEKLKEECAKIREHLQTEHKTELENKEREWQNKFKILTESLQEAAAAHRKLEGERDKFFIEKKEMEENLIKYKRKFVAELNRDLGSMCVQMGNGVNRALMDVMVRLNAEYSPAPVPPPLGGNFNFDGGDPQITLRRAILPNETPQSSRQQRQQPQNCNDNENNLSTDIRNCISPTPITRSRSKTNQQQMEQQQSAQTAHSTSDYHHQQQPTDDEPIMRFSSPPSSNNAASTNSPASSSISMIAVRSSNCPAQSQNHHQPSQQFNLGSSNSTSNMAPPPLQQISQNTHSINKRGRKAKGGEDTQNLTTMTMAKKRPLMAAICTHPHEHFINNTQVPVNILAKTKPWRPPGGGQVFPAICNNSATTKNQRDHPSTSNLVNQQNIPPTKINQCATVSGSNIRIGPPLFTSTPTKKRFPTFQL